MTINQIATQLFTHFSPEERSIPDNGTYPGRNAAVMLAMNGAMQELYGKASPWVRYEERGALLNAPTAVTLAVTNGSTAATVTGWADWMAGCSVVSAGSAIDNRIRNDSASAVLVYPWDGATGNVAATVYHDCVTVGTDVMEIVGPVRVDRMPVGPMVSGDAPIFGTEPSEEDYGFHLRSVTVQDAPRLVDHIGRPLGYAVETWSKEATAGPRYRILLKPATDVARSLDYRAMLAPPAVITDLGSSSTLPVPMQYIQSIFYPIARQRLSACAFYRADGQQLEEVARAYKDALALLDGLKPQKRSGVSLGSLY